jgi:hypothetical protein
MSDARPRKDETEGAANLLAGARERLAVALDDLRLPEHLRLSEWQRNTIENLRARMVRQIEDELRSALAEALQGEGLEALHAALSSAHVVIAQSILEDAAIPPDPALTGALLRRAEEHRLLRAGAADNALLLELAGDADENIAGEAMALLIAQSSRFDRFQEPVMARTELRAETQHSLVWTIAAALRLYMIDQQGYDPASADEALAAAASRLLADYDEGESVEALSLRLIRRLRDDGRLTDSLMSDTLFDGSLPLFLAGLSVRTSLDFVSTWEIASEPSGRGIVLLLLAAGIARETAGPILVRLGESEDRLTAQFDLFDVTSVAEARRLLRLWRFDPGYRAAIARLAA